MKHESPGRELPREGEIFDGKYRIGPVLGVGGMAAVVAAQHLGFDERVAIKVLLPECCDDPAVVERFVQEGKTAIKIRSEHVVRMLDVGVAAGRAYLVMEYLDGKDLDALVREGGTLAVDTAVDMLLQACEAIGEAHALGIIHRDLKPANLFLTHRVDGAPCVKVLDFGISKMPRSVSGANLAGSHPTLPAVVMGSPQYMAPEQMVSAASADQRSDIWSLGAILYELLTAQLAFGGASTAEVCARVLRGTPVPIAQLRAGLPDEIVFIIGRCFEKDRSRRYPNVAELARALAPFGTRGARASADSIAKVFEGGIEARPPAMSGDATMKPTAAAILAAAPARRTRASGYLLGSFVALAAVGGVLASVVHSGAFHLPQPVASEAPTPVLAAAPLPMIGPPDPTPSVSASDLHASPARARHVKRFDPAPTTRSALPVPEGDEDAGPYDAP